MRNPTRNRLLSRFFLTFYLAVAAVLVWVLGEVDRWRGPRFWVFAAGIAVFLVWVCLGIRRDRRELDALEHELRQAGVQIRDEQPIPIKLARDTESLIASIIALVLIAAAFIAHYTGWLERIGLEAANPR